MLAQSLKFFLVLCCTQLIACADTSNTRTIDWSQQRNMRSPDTDFEHQLLAEENGWQVWRRIFGRYSRCIAVKPASGRDWPQYGQEISPVSGGAGFYMLWDKAASAPYFGFYGAHVYGRQAFAWLDDVAIQEINNQDVVMSWEGMLVDFTVTTQPLPNVYAEALKLSGQVDFTGVQQAFEPLQRCSRTYLN